jgi:hypothetical protein
LLGPNGSGKSTFLDVVALLSYFVDLGMEEALIGKRGRARRLDEFIFNQRATSFELAVEFEIPAHLHLRSPKQSDWWALGGLLSASEAYVLYKTLSAFEGLGGGF